MKIVFFDVKSYDKKFLEPLVGKINDLPMFANEKPEITLLSTKLNSETVNLAADADIVSLFVHDKLDKDMLPSMKCRLVACRSAGFDYVDLKECAARGIKVVSVPS
jgi:lactate dehydrogenase-like 2-hydroxyacid dehydrogenase